MKILVVENGHGTIHSLVSGHPSYGHVEVISSLGEFERIKKKHFDLAFVALDFQGPMDGLELLKQLQGVADHRVAISCRQDQETIYRAYSSGCHDYFVLPFSQHQLSALVERARLKFGGAKMRDFFQRRFWSQDRAFQLGLLDSLHNALKVRSIFFEGETGTGKTFLAESIHRDFLHGPFVHLNCAELSEEIIESELFGHERGAFTGASRSFGGKLALADGGALFLDEIGALSLKSQKKLLTVLEKKSYFAVGGAKSRVSDFFLMSATCENLWPRVQRGQFREDLFYRIASNGLLIPPLRERRGDIELIIKRELSASQRKIFLSPDGLEVLKNDPWPGNARELKGLINKILSSEKGIFDGPEIAQELQKARRRAVVLKKGGFQKTIKNFERALVDSVYEQNGQSVRKTLKDLKMSATTFYRIRRGEDS